MSTRKTKATDRAGPLRVSSDPSDPGYKTWLETFAGCAQVIFNGVDLGDTALMADEETGEVHVMKIDRDNNIVLSDGAPVIVKLRGTVEIRKIAA